MRSYFLVFAVMLQLFAHAQEAAPVKKEKGSFYFSWGYNRDWFSKSTLHFKNTSGNYNPVTGRYDSYDFTIYDATAKDRPGFKNLLRSDLTIPQYNYRIGYFFKKRKSIGIEINFDHVKYIMNDNQTLRVKGYIMDQQIDQDTLINPNNFLHFEHSDGANFLMLNIIKKQKFLGTKNGNQLLAGVIKIGAGAVIPRTDVTLFGQRLNNKFHVAGYCAGVEAGLRYEAFKHIYLEYTAKGSFANYTNVLVIGNGKAHHYFWCFENILVLGLQFPL